MFNLVMLTNVTLEHGLITYKYASFCTTQFAFTGLLWEWITFGDL